MLARPWGICFLVLWVQRIEELVSNFIENPFCYFSFSSSNSESPISSIIWVHVQNSAQNITHLCTISKKSLGFTCNINRYGTFIQSTIWEVRFCWATRMLFTVCNVVLTLISSFESFLLPSIRREGWLYQQYSPCEGCNVVAAKTLKKRGSITKYSY